MILAKIKAAIGLLAEEFGPFPFPSPLQNQQQRDTTHEATYTSIYTSPYISTLMTDLRRGLYITYGKLSSVAARHSNTLFYLAGQAFLDGALFAMTQHGRGMALVTCLVMS